MQTILLSTHILGEVELTCDRVLLIHKGKLKADDTPRNLVRKLRVARNVKLEVRAKEKVTGALEAITGVRRVIRCDAEGAAMLTSKGTLELTGAELSVTSLDLDKGEVKLTGRVDTLEYTAEHTPGGFLRRLVR